MAEWAHRRARKAKNAARIARGAKRTVVLMNPISVGYDASCEKFAFGDSLLAMSDKFLRGSALASRPVAGQSVTMRTQWPILQKLLSLQADEAWACWGRGAMQPRLSHWRMASRSRIGIVMGRSDPTLRGRAHRRSTAPTECYCGRHAPDGRPAPQNSSTHAARDSPECFQLASRRFPATSCARPDRFQEKVGGWRPRPPFPIFRD